MTTPTVKLDALTHSAMQELLPKMKPGQALIYHVGSLMHDRLRGASFQRVHGVAVAAWEAYEKGEVNLFQRKLPGQFEFEYIAIRK